jgi:hypothetical protein
LFVCDVTIIWADWATPASRSGDEIPVSCVDPRKIAALIVAAVDTFHAARYRTRSSPPVATTSPATWSGVVSVVYEEDVVVCSVETGV